MQTGNHTKSLLSVVALLALLLSVSTASAEGRSATAELKNADSEVVSTATFTETDEGVEISVEASGLEPGLHGIHIHETGTCEPADFKSAGGHFNPGDAMHGLESAEGPHAGDLPNIEVAEDGSANYKATTARVTLDEGQTSLFDTDGSSLVIHAGEDDQVTDPSGDSGDRIACGVIQMSAGVPSTGGGGTAGGNGFPTQATVLIGALALGTGLLARRLIMRLG